MAPNPRFSSIGLISTGILCFIVSAITYAIFNHKTHYQYGIIIDSGAPNVTINLYRWPYERINRTGQVELKESCLGEDLTHHLDNASQVLKPCLETVIKSLQSHQQSSPVYFEATGNLRLLNITSPEKVNQLLESVKEFLTNETNLVVRSVSLLDDTRGAVYPWIAVNSKSLAAGHHHQAQPMSGVLDLCPMGACLSYEVNENSSQKVTPVSLYGQNYSIYSENHLCLGTEKGRLRFVTLLIQDRPDELTLEDPCLPINITKTVSTVDLISDECLKGNRKLPSDKEYTLIGKGDAKLCSSMISSKLLDEAKCRENFEYCFTVAKNHPENVVYTAISDYLYPLHAIHLSGETITDEDYLNQTEAVCSLSRDEILSQSGRKLDPGSVCFQLMYNYWIIKNVHGIPGNWSNIRFDQSLRGNSQVSWQTGYMIENTNSIDPVEEPKPWFSWSHFLIVSAVSFLFIIIGLYFLAISFKTPRVPNKEIYEPIQQQPQP